MGVILLDNITILTERRAVRTMRLTVYRDGRVRLVIPWHTSEDAAREFVGRKADWIQRHHLQMMQKRLGSELHYVTGEEHLLFGKQLPLFLQPVSSGSQAVIQQADTLVMYCKSDTDKKHRQALMKTFYRNQLQRYLTERLEVYTLLYKESGVQFHIRQMKTEWGSCMARRRSIIFNLELARVPYSLVDYVIVHELCHLQVSNHGAEFKQLMTRRMPDWKERKLLLNDFVK